MRNYLTPHPATADASSTPSRTVTSPGSPGTRSVSTPNPTIGLTTARDVVDDGGPTDELGAGVSVVVPSFQGVATSGCVPGLLGGADDGSRPVRGDRRPQRHAGRQPRAGHRTRRAAPADHLAGRGAARPARRSGGCNAGSRWPGRTFIALVDDDDTITPATSPRSMPTPRGTWSRWPGSTTSHPTAP